jgi:hypothetical protein
MPKGAEAEARAFFVTVLGMVEEEKPESLRSRGGCWFRSGGCHVHLGVDPAFQPQKKSHSAFVVHDLMNLADRIKSSGHEVSWYDSLPGRKRFYTHDPFGNRLEFIRDGDGLSQR